MNTIIYCIKNWWFDIIYQIDELWFELKMKWRSKHAARSYGYSETFHTFGYWLNDTKWFVPIDGSFKYGYAPK